MIVIICMYVSIFKGASNILGTLLVETFQQRKQIYEFLAVFQNYLTACLIGT